MVPLLFVLFLVVPVVELAVIIQVGHIIGVWDTLGLLLALSLGGAWLVKREGIGVVRRFRRQLEAGTIPGKELADGVLILLAGALLLTPGFVTDALGLLFLLPPVRAVLRAGAMRRLAIRAHYRRDW
ncbi:MAG: FxsA family protein [Acidimicrobiales bacterium]